MPDASHAASDAPENCSQCRFWEFKRDREGFCRRSAPFPEATINEIARWRQTRAQDWCGEGERATGGVPAIHCKTCRFWFRPDNGIQPLLLGDHFRAWWQNAGLCRRYAPRANAELGGRSFWPCTHDSDSCAEGRPPDADSPRGEAEVWVPEI